MYKQSLYDLTAIQIGIGKRWDFKNESDSFDARVEFMREKKYDILPLKNLDGYFNNFMVTDEWNHFDKIKMKHKSELPKLKADSNFLSILKEFINNKEKYFLLHQGATIVGLISVVNFSYPEIYKRLYNELLELEILLADWIFKEINEDDVFDILLERNQSEVIKSVLGSYLIDQRTGNDGPLKEYLYLSSLHTIIRNKGLFTNLGYSSKEWKHIGDPLFETRNSIAHPVRSIIREKKDFQKVLVCIEAISKINNKIRKN